MPEKPSKEKESNQVVGSGRITAKMAAAQLELLLDKFDLKIEPLSDLTERMSISDRICWQGSAINC